MNTANILSNHNVRPSIIRLMIYDYVKDKKSHPTVEEIYQNLHPLVPTLSKTSVYNTVKLFTLNGLFKALTIDPSQIRYDADVAHHGHFWCDGCHKVFDFKIDTDCELGLDGFDVTQREIFYSGLCNECISKKVKN